MYKIIFRVDGHCEIGLGHIVRCLALAAMLRDDAYISFACQKHEDHVLKIILDEGFNLIELPNEFDFTKDANRLNTYLGNDIILILDGYRFDESYQLTVKPCCHKLVCIDDIHKYHFYSDIIINHCLHAPFVKYSCEKETQLLLGGDYALLRRPFLEKTNFQRDTSKKIKKIMICMGGSDSKNYSLLILQSLYESDMFLTVNIVMGIANQNIHSMSQDINKYNGSKLDIKILTNLTSDEMCNQIMNNDFIFTTGSTTALEACCIGIPMIIGITVDNQVELTEILEKQQAALSISWYKDITMQNLSKEFTTLIKSPNKLSQFIVNQKKMIDGKSNLRYQKIFKKLARSF